LRRRVTALGRNALCLACSLPELEKARYVFSSRHGEFSRTLSILENIAESQELSPAGFSLSVHHALISLLSIENNNNKGHIAVAGGDESFCCGLIEALACLAEKPEEPVLYIHCDEPLPRDYALFNGQEDSSIVIALFLRTKGGEGFSVQAVDGVDEGDQNKEKTSMAFSFLQFLKGKELEVNYYSQNRCWHWKRYGMG